ncbi:PDZ domain-containing protein 9 isoform X2 [Cygnus olor]|uniref:PDZ domain-containing protein 9 isoform X2 n=1 Tax=Cygnus olor TaxID=8869 RepID=UPI001ADE1FB0|nr:PDZ domain-containing protein 9 isoform X2 [Cygnus olor]
MPHVPVPASLASRLLLTRCGGLGICLPQHSEQLVGVEVPSLSASTLLLYRSSWRHSAFPRGSPKTHLPSDFDCIETSLCLDSMEHKQSWATGDVLIKIGHADVLGCTLQELGKLLLNIPVGTTLQIRVYRDFIEVPQHWQSAVELIPEIKLPVTTADTSEDTEDEDTGTSSDDDTDSETFQYTSSQSSCSEFTHELPSIYKIWYVSDTIQTLTEGRDSGCDIVLHNDVDALCNSEFDASGVGPPSYRTVENSETSSSSSHSSV